MTKSLFSPVPEQIAVCVAGPATSQMAKLGTSMYMKLELTVTTGPDKGRKLWWSCSWLPTIRELGLPETKETLHTSEGMHFVVRVKHRLLGNQIYATAEVLRRLYIPIP